MCWRNAGSARDRDDTKAPDKDDQAEVERSERDGKRENPSERSAIELKSFLPQSLEFIMLFKNGNYHALIAQLSVAWLK